MDIDYIKSYYMHHVKTVDKNRKPDKEDKFILSPDGKICCIVYATEEVRMMYYLSKVAIVKSNISNVSINTIEGWFYTPSYEDIWINDTIFLSKVFSRRASQKI